MTPQPTTPSHGTDQSPGQGSEAAIEVRLRSRPIYLAGTRELVVGLCRRLGFPEQVSGQIALATDEALANVINHGYGRRPDGLIWLKLWPESSPGVRGIRVVIEDEGEQIDPEAIFGRDLDDVRPGGLGVHIMRQVMDHVRHEKRDPDGMRLTMSKALPDPAGEQDQQRESNASG
ncbi:MAG: ATP-binding protein [Planctomycetota bacterium]